MSSGRRTGLLVGGLAALAVLVVGVWAAVLVRVLGSDDPDAAPTDAYVVVDRLCESIDTSAASAVLPVVESSLSENTVDTVTGTLRDCLYDLVQGDSMGGLWIKVNVYDSPESAARGYESDLSTGTISTNSDTIEDIDGPWQEGAVGLGAAGAPYTAGAEICVRDLNLTVCVAMRLRAAPDLGTAPTDDDVAAAVRQVAQDALERSTP